MMETPKDGTQQREMPRHSLQERKTKGKENKLLFFSSFTAAALSGLAIAVAMYYLKPYLLLALAASQAASTPAHGAPKVKVANGTYAGVHSKEFKQDFFLGMPYAKPAERFTVAKGLDTAWHGVKDAKAYPPHCFGYGDDNVGYDQSEDCLYLNVVRPAGIKHTADLPVAVWIHGGGLYMGGSADKRYNLTYIVDQSVQMGKPMIGVSLNYRVSAFGFLNGKEALDAGITNIGFRDQRLALHWVQENIKAFGGSPKKVTIWGESSGAESVAAQVLAYNGRDDGLFRAAIGQSGFGGILPRLPGGFNETKAAQAIFDAFVSSTSCAPLVGTPGSIDCLRKAPFEELNTVLASGKVGDLPSTWPPVLDHDFFQDYTANQLVAGNFAQVPLLIGTNSDEGTGFGIGRSGGPINTDEGFAKMLKDILKSENTDKTPDELATELMQLYPNDQPQGIPSLETWPHIIQPGDSFAKQLGEQFRRVSAVIGDYFFQYTRRRSNLVWTAHGIPSYAYRFDVVPNGLTDFIGATHFQEVAFVFRNLNGDGYAVNPFGGDDQEYISQAKHLSNAMSTAWVNFVTGLDPNGAKGLPNGIVWPEYSASASKVGQDLVWDLGKSFTEDDNWREEGMAWFMDHSLSVFGN